MKCHVLDYENLGDDMQIVEVELDPNETVIAEAGAMNYKDAFPCAAFGTSIQLSTAVLTMACKELKTSIQWCLAVKDNLLPHSRERVRSSCKVFRFPD